MRRTKANKNRKEEDNRRPWVVTVPTINRPINFHPTAVPPLPLKPYLSHRALAYTGSCMYIYSQRRQLRTRAGAIAHFDYIARDHLVPLECIPPSLHSLASSVSRHADLIKEAKGESVSRVCVSIRASLPFRHCHYESHGYVMRARALLPFLFFLLICSRAHLHTISRVNKYTYVRKERAEVELCSANVIAIGARSLCSFRAKRRMDLTTLLLVPFFRGGVVFTSHGMGEGELMV